MIKTYGLIFANGTKQLTSVCLDEEGNPRIDTIRPYPLPKDWVDPRLIELVKIEQPDGDNWQPVLVWFEDRVERQWEKL
jgi:hypothetical protein